MFKCQIMILAVTLILILQSGCDGAGLGSGEVSCNGAVTELEGGWQFCSTATGEYTSYTFSKNCVTKNVKNYSNSDCTGSISLDESEKSTFVIGQTVMTDGGQTAQEIDTTRNDVTQYDIYWLQGNILFYGLPTTQNNKTSSSTRPTSINYGVTYARIP